MQAVVRLLRLLFKTIAQPPFKEGGKDNARKASSLSAYISPARLPTMSFLPIWPARMFAFADSIYRYRIVSS